MARRNHIAWIIGIDEVGRGALAGPVTVAAAMFPANVRGRITHIPSRSLKDSKKLSASRREVWARKLTSVTGVAFAIARIYPRGIDRLNISGAANVAASRALFRLLKCHKSLANMQIYLDGGLFLESKEHQRKAVKTGRMHVETVVKGDERIPAVAAASIIAKVSRDRYMARLAKEYPAYGFEIHKGYGTVAHRRAILKNGRCAAHRLTFGVK